MVGIEQYIVISHSNSKDMVIARTWKYQGLVIESTVIVRNGWEGALGGWGALVIESKSIYT